MSCYLFKVGTSVVLDKSVRRSFHGQMIRFSAGTTAQVTAIDTENHKISVRFPGTDKVFTIDAHAVQSKTRTPKKFATHSPSSSKATAETKKLKDKLSKIKQRKIGISKKRG